MLWGAQLGPAVPRAEVYARLHGVQCRLASWPRFHFWEQDQPFFPCENYTLISSSSNMTEYIYILYESWWTTNVYLLGPICKFIGQCTNPQFLLARFPRSLVWSAFFTVKPLKSPILVAKLSHCWLAKIRRIVWWTSQILGPQIYRFRCHFTLQPRLSSYVTWSLEKALLNLLSYGKMWEKSTKHGIFTKIGKTGFWKIDGSFRQRWRSKRCGDLPIALEFGEVNGHGWVGSPTKSGNTRHKVDIGSTLHFQVLLRPLLFGLGWRFGYSDILGKATHVLMLLGIVGLKGCYPQMAFCLKIWPHSNQSKPQRGQEHFEHEVHEADGFSVAGHAQRDPKSQKFLLIWWAVQLCLTPSKLSTFQILLDPSS